MLNISHGTVYNPVFFSSGRLLQYLVFTQSFWVFVVCRDLDQASMEAVVSLLAGLPLQPEEGDGVELMEAKSQLFLK